MLTIIAEGDKTFEAPEGKKLVLTIEDAGIDILHRCGGHARCTTCRVQIIAGDAGTMNDAERERLATERDLEPNTRLSCQIHCQHDLTLKVFYHLSATELSDPGSRPED